ncbi:tRNA (adenosine(37)-N6)-threonylcarbamoyltransferase complex transferase subunit TsaD [Candidatus Nomurabacteria bacterium GWB1_40_6]|uniref:tRNA N6-adenosine threonylcarbamoyltransferase n=1 Tax=Candidatus Nomurabacteria bacterium GWB1_40_6 TaxID=1801727 RepID=A0A1F6TM25_9BACT|nr:MAG: tRNA (adenosine(37)-N6)-threonylcarbamoyltransferase complex transferase subunit TsaD [Candidatus Nomurabacteria bacterium GWB1_40_6]
MKILSIETSCDDTGISILDVKGGVKNARHGGQASFKVLANNVSSQIDVHIPYGGVYPALAKREHTKNLPFVLEKTFKDAKLDEKSIDAIAVTYGPGLEITLWTGITFAQELAKKWNVPIIPVNHMEGHMFSVFGKGKGKFKIPAIKTPILALLVSGGHTELVLMKKWPRPYGYGRGSQYERIGETVDDAVGEAFDKVARTLGLPYPGGPQISKLAEQERECAPTPGVGEFSDTRCRGKFALPRPMLYSKNFDFSYSGLKTAVLYLVRDLGGIKKISETTKAQIALEFENAAIECLVYKTKKAIEKYKIKTLIVAGGVSANRHLKKEMQKITKGKIKLFFPPKELTGDNSLMIGIAGYLNYIKNKKKTPQPNSIKANSNLRL